MKRADEQLLEEATNPQLAAFLRSGGTLEVGEDFSVGAFARIRKCNKTVVVDAAYRDFATILMEMNSLASNHFEQESESLGTPGSE